MLLILQFKMKISHKKKISSYNLESKIYDMEKQINDQQAKISLLSEQLGTVFSRTNTINSKLDTINDLIIKIDKNFFNSNTSHYNDEISPKSYHVSNNNHIIQSQKKGHDILISTVDSIEQRHHNSTIEYILKKLDEEELTTRELQQYIGRTREHTSRLLKKMYDNKLVNRNMNSKPFKYTITDEGRKLLIKHSALKNNYHSEYPNTENSIDELTEIRYP